MQRAEKSFLAKAETTTRDWVLVDASAKPLGRLASEIATRLMGKHKPTYTPHCDVGDFVIVVNADKVLLTGRKWEQKEHDYYTYYPGGHKIVPYARLRDQKPELVIKLAVRGMMPKSRLGRTMLAKLKVFRGTEHPHVAQQPKALAV